MLARRLKEVTEPFWGPVRTVSWNGGREPYGSIRWRTLMKRACDRDSNLGCDPEIVRFHARETRSHPDWASIAGVRSTVRQGTIR